MKELVVVAGGGGFIGGHLVRRLRSIYGGNIRAVDLKPLRDWDQRFDDVENVQADVADRSSALRVTQGASHIFDLAADMGGMGFIEQNRARCMLSVLCTTHLLLAAKAHSVKRFFFASSACVYAACRQSEPHSTLLREEDAYPAQPEDGYGWEKLFGERMCRHFLEDFSVETRVARLHNVYGPHCTFDGGREKAPAALCRKVAAAKLQGKDTIRIWGDGQQTRTFMHVDDCVRGILAIMESEIRYPINLGSAEVVAIDQLVDIIEAIAGVKLKRLYDPQAPQGVRGRGSDNGRLRAELGWEPSIGLREGLQDTYNWIYGQMVSQQRTAKSDGRFLEGPGACRRDSLAAAGC